MLVPVSRAWSGSTKPGTMRLGIAHGHTRVVPWVEPVGREGRVLHVRRWGHVWRGRHMRRWGHVRRGRHLHVHWTAKAWTATPRLVPIAYSAPASSTTASSVGARVWCAHRLDVGILRRRLQRRVVERRKDRLVHEIKTKTFRRSGLFSTRIGGNGNVRRGIVDNRSAR